MQGSTADQVRTNPVTIAICLIIAVLLGSIAAGQEPVPPPISGPEVIRQPAAHQVVVEDVKPFKQKPIKMRPIEQLPVGHSPEPLAVEATDESQDVQPVISCDCEGGCEKCQSSSTTTVTVAQSGGWLQFGYMNHRNGLMNNLPHRFDAKQAYLYFENKAARDGDIGLGYRFDLMYGVDAIHGQSFGNNPGNWDFQHGWDRGAGYGWAMPQLYAEVATESLSVKLGHFYSIVGYESITAPDNFFFSHSLTMFNSEPFTHTGVLAHWDVDCDLTMYGGWTLGWNTGFDEFDPPGGSGTGSNFIGGFGAQLTEESKLKYVTTIGNMGRRGEGYTHSIVLEYDIIDNVRYVLQSDLVSLDTIAPGNNDEVGINQYLFYTINNEYHLGARLEWWKSDAGFNHGGQSAVTGGSASYYEASFGLNYHSSEKTIIRPEVRYDWFPHAGYTQTTFAVDIVMLF